LRKVLRLLVMARPILAKIGQALDVAVVVGAFATIPLTLSLEQGAVAPWTHLADWAVWAVFLAEFVFKTVFIKVGFRQRLFLAAVVALSFPALPALLGLVRVLRAIRVVRASRALRLIRVMGATAWGVEAIRAVLGRRSMVYVSALCVLIILAGGGGIALLEPETAHGGFLDGIWWAIVTASTVGYGDIAPVTFLGRAIAVVLMLTGVGLISTLAASITTYFLGQQGNEELIAIKSQLTRIESLLNRMQVEPAVELAESARSKDPSSLVSR
jgi:voltage-gated potassium channel